MTMKTYLNKLLLICECDVCVNVTYCYDNERKSQFGTPVFSSLSLEDQCSNVKFGLPGVARQILLLTAEAHVSSGIYACPLCLIPQYWVQQDQQSRVSYRSFECRRRVRKLTASLYASRDFTNDISTPKMPRLSQSHLPEKKQTFLFGAFRHFDIWAPISLSLFIINHYFNKKMRSIVN